MVVADVPGGVSSTPSAIEQIPSPEFARCAKLGTNYGPNQIAGTDMAIVGHGENTGMFPFEMESSWRGPLSVGGVVCKGTVSYRSVLELRSGKLSKKVPKSAMVFRVPAQTSGDEQTETRTLRGTIDSQPLCAISRELQGETPPTVRLVKEEERRYTEGNGFSVHTNNEVSLGRFVCDSAESSTGGLGVEEDSGTGGVGAR